MSRATGRHEALGEIAALVSSGKPPSEVLKRVLEATRKAIGARCLSLVAAVGKEGRVRSWTAQTPGSVALAERCIEAGAVACVGPARLHEQDGMFIAPLSYGEHLRAAIVGDSCSDPKLIEAVSGYLSLMLSNERASGALAAAWEQSAKRAAEVSAVYEIGQAINELDTDHLLALITEKAASVMDAQACSLLLRDFESNCLTIGASWGLPDEIVRGTRVPLGQGIAGVVAQTCESMLLVDVGSDPRFASSYIKPREGISSSICAPLKDESGRVMGVLSIRRHIPAPPFTEEDMRLFCIFASQAALAISNSRLYTSLTRRIAEMSTISSLLQAINSTLDLGNVLSQIADSIVKVVGFDRCCVYLLDPRAGEFMAGVRRGYAAGELPERVAPGQGVIGLAAKELIPIFERDSSGKEGAFLATPIVVRDQCIGVVVVDNTTTGRPVQQPDVELLSMFVSQAGIAIENARLYEAMEEKYSELNVLFEHSKTITSAYGLENVTRISTDVVRKAVACDGCALLLLGDKRATVTLQAASGFAEDVLESGKRLFEGESAIEFMRSLRSPTVITRSNAGDLSEDAQDLVRVTVGANGSALLVPLLAEDAAVGAFLLVRHGRRQFAIGEIKLLSIIASQVAVVLKNALRYEQRMRRQVLDLSLLYEFSRRISSSSSLEEALDAILAIVSDLVDCDGSAIYAVDHERGLMVPTAARQARGQPHKLPQQPLAGSNVMSWTVMERKAVVSPDISGDSRFEPVSLGDQPVRSLMSIPLMVQDEAVGVLCVYSASPNLYSEDDARVLSIIASQSAAIYKELEALAALTSYTDNILSSIAGGVVALDRDGVVLTWNRAAEAIVGLKADRVVGRNYREVIARLPVTEADRASTVEIIEKVQTTGNTYQGYKLCYHPLDGNVVYINLSASVLSDNAGKPLGLVIIFEDVTKEIKMENEFRRMGELAAVGQLAASIAHELRNPLSSIKGAAQYLQKEYEDHAAIVEFLNIIVDEVNGLSKLTTEFLEFARPVEMEVRDVDVNAVVTRTLQLMSVHMGESGAVVVERLSDDLPTIQADEKQLEQVLRNVILNALQAMPGGGTLTINTSASGQSVELSVADTGTGIAEDKLDRIFVPFFTTKTKGTGLGLPVVQKIVENHGGHIEVASRPGEGTVFTIVLPRTGAVRTPPPEADTTERREQRIGDC